MSGLKKIGVVGSLAAAGVAFVVYPALRPYGPETGMAGAADFGSTSWLVAHALGMLGFVLVAVALRTASTGAPWPWNGRALRETETLAWLAVALLLPYYGAETYGLRAIGGYAVEHGEARVLEVADAFRLAPFAAVTFAIGLLLLVPVGWRIARGLWQAGRIARYGGLLAGIGLATYLPQFFGSPGLRMAHGLVLGLGLVLMAVAGAVRPPMSEDALARPGELTDAPR
jgi:hypothetical protein